MIAAMQADGADLLCFGLECDGQPRLDRMLLSR